MSEPRGEYMGTPKEILCQQCHSKLGVQVEIGGKTYLQVGGVVLHSAHGVCASCGWPYHWATLDKQLEKLIAALVVKL